MFRRAAATFIILSAAATARAESCLWPLNEPRKISSSFAEYRDGHYHAGLDLRTFGRIGLPCLAPDVCEVARLRVSPNGYGKAVYLRLKDGRMAVFAHLNDFSPELDSLAYDWRLKRGRNWCDIEPSPGTIRFDAGETIAFTGTTGSLYPHLHFEMRDSAGRPFNPLASMYRIPDSFAPVISGLEAVPLSWGSLANGSPLPITARFRLVHGAQYALDDTLLLDGTFGFGVSAYDKQVAGSYRMGPYSVELAIDGNIAYRMRNEKFDYSQSAGVSLEYENRGGNAPGRYLVLFKKPANSMSGREGSGVVANDVGFSDAIVLSAGLHEGKIVVRDANGNEAQGLFRFVLSPSPVVVVSRVAAGGAARIELDVSDPSDTAEVTAALSGSVDGGQTWSPVALERSSPHSFAGMALGAPWALYRCTVRNGCGARVERYCAFPDPRTDTDSVF
ncbi:MAG: M23 family metallopeptidase, partial [Candidatus Krumholzibacteria bacterium]|nr:M23 family metallopeptidase [Candidatus Krumholzibacteria bacterium]